MIPRRADHGTGAGAECEGHTGGTGDTGDTSAAALAVPAVPTRIMARIPVRHREGLARGQGGG